MPNPSAVSHQDPPPLLRLPNEILDQILDCVLFPLFRAALAPRRPGTGGKVKERNKEDNIIAGTARDNDDTLRQFRGGLWSGKITAIGDFGALIRVCRRLSRLTLDYFWHDMTFDLRSCHGNSPQFNMASFYRPIYKGNAGPVLTNDRLEASWACHWDEALDFSTTRWLGTNRKRIRKWKILILIAPSDAAAFNTFEGWTYLQSQLNECVNIISEAYAVNSVVLKIGLRMKSAPPIVYQHSFGKTVDTYSWRDACLLPEIKDWEEGMCAAEDQGHLSGIDPEDSVSFDADIAFAEAARLSFLDPLKRLRGIEKVEITAPVPCEIINGIKQLITSNT
ncbi:MAG: hypothetical protein M1820_000118 [Bogoriella megaspora]|nr:MAG: hypothetical protein M1820_000118 [Bogoriella megaspora]